MPYRYYQYLTGIDTLIDASGIADSPDIREGTTVLTQGTGGVSCFAIQVS
jgi:NADPH:quinone reductase-like Zn-dependent oxidoreductase